MSTSSSSPHGYSCGSHPSKSLLIPFQLFLCLLCLSTPILPLNSLSKQLLALLILSFLKLNFPLHPRAMYGHHGNSFPRAADPYVEWPYMGLQPQVAPLLLQPQLEVEQQMLEAAAAAVSNTTSCASSGNCSSYSSPSSLGSTQQPSLIQRSVSSHSLQKNGSHPVLSSVAELLMDSETSSVRRVYSTGDLQVT